MNQWSTLITFQMLSWTTICKIWINDPHQQFAKVVRNNNSWYLQKNDPQRQFSKMKKIKAEFALLTLHSLKVFSIKAYVWEMYLLHSLRLYIRKCPRQVGNIKDFQNLIKACQIAKLGEIQGIFSKRLLERV